MQCPIARSLERVGEWWSILILRDAFHGLTRFDQFQKSLGIAPNMLTRRLNALVEAGLLERRRYSERPPRDEYVLTERGRDFRPVLWALLAWGNKHFAPEGPSVVVVDAETGRLADPVAGRPRQRQGDVARHVPQRAGPGRRRTDTGAPRTQPGSRHRAERGTRAMSEQVIGPRVSPRPPRQIRRRPRACKRRRAWRRWNFAALLGGALLRLITGGRSAASSRPPTTPMSAATSRRSRRTSPGSSAQILVADNQHVDAGQILIRLDPQDYQAALRACGRACCTGGRRRSPTCRRQRVLQQLDHRRAPRPTLARKRAQAEFAAQDDERYRVPRT